MTNSYGNSNGDFFSLFHFLENKELTSTKAFKKNKKKALTMQKMHKIFLFSQKMLQNRRKILDVVSFT